MDYLAHYNALIARARTRALTGPSESHHIQPRCMGGKDGKKNEIDLTPEEHYLAHLLLVRIFPNVQGLLLAAVLMSRDNRNGKRSNNKLYGWLRRRAAAAQSLQQTGRRNSPETRAKISAILKASAAHAANIETMRGMPRTEEVKRKVSEALQASEVARIARAALHQAKLGIPRSAETKAKISAANTGRIMSEEQRQKISAANKGKPHSPEHNAKVGRKGRKSPMTGREHSPETKEKMRLAALARKHTPETIEKLKSTAAQQTQEQRSARAIKAWETKRRKAAEAAE